MSNTHDSKPGKVLKLRYPAPILAYLEDMREHQFIAECERQVAAADKWIRAEALVVCFLFAMAAVCGVLIPMKLMGY